MKKTIKTVILIELNMKRKVQFRTQQLTAGLWKDMQNWSVWRHVQFRREECGIIT